MKEKIRKIKESISNAPHKKKAIIAMLVALCRVGGAAGGYSYMTHTDFGKADVASQSDDKELTAEEKEKAAEKDLEKAKESGDKEAVKEAEKEVEKAKEKVNASNSTSSSNSSNHKSNSGTSNKGSYTKPSNSGSSGSSSSSASKPSKPAHQHDWQPVYVTKQVSYQVDEGGTYVTVCTNCGEELTLNSYREHQENHLLNGESSGRKEVYKPHYVTKYRTEKVFSHYKCSCGATK